MTDLLERPAPDAPSLDGLARRVDQHGEHDHTARCWWHPYEAGWVCPPGGTA